MVPILLWAINVADNGERHTTGSFHVTLNSEGKTKLGQSKHLNSSGYRTFIKVIFGKETLA